MASRQENVSKQARLDRLLLHVGAPPAPDLTSPSLYERELAALETAHSPKPVKHSVSRPEEDLSQLSIHSKKSPEELEDLPPQAIEYIPSGKQSLSHNTYDYKQVAIANMDNHTDSPEKSVIYFCVFALLAKFPYKYMNDPDSRVSRQFFASNKFYDRPWNLYYLHPPTSIGGNTLILVPYSEASQLIKEIRDAFEVDVSVPQFPFSIPFSKDGTPQPVFLGISKNREMYNDLHLSIPTPPPGFDECPPDAPTDLRRSYDIWRDKFKQARAATKSKASRKAQKDYRPRLREEQSSILIRRLHSYFGLRTSCEAVHCSLPSPGAQQKEECDHIKTPGNNNGLTTIIDLNQPAPHSNDKEIIIVCMDVEWDETNPNTLTEIGISTLDTSDLKDVAPGPGAQNWTFFIRSRHIRIRGTESIRNRRWCHGNPKAFEFGTTEWATLPDALRLVDDCFQWPLPTRAEPFPGSAEIQVRDHDNENHSKSVTTDESQASTEISKNRNIVLLGHDVMSDIIYMSNMGNKTFGNVCRHLTSPDFREPPPGFLEILDTAIIDQKVRGADQIRSLGKICADLDMSAWNLHNAGNDARYTLEAMVKLVLKAGLKADQISHGAAAADS